MNGLTLMHYWQVVKCRIWALVGGSRSVGCVFGGCVLPWPLFVIPFPVSGHHVSYSASRHAPCHAGLKPSKCGPKTRCSFRLFLSCILVTAMQKQLTHLFSPVKYLPNVTLNFAFLSLGWGRNSRQSLGPAQGREIESSWSQKSERKDLG
jgi:hypothetical protein